MEHIYDSVIICVGNGIKNCYCILGSWHWTHL